MSLIALETISYTLDSEACEDADTRYLVELQHIVPAGKILQGYSVRIRKQAGNLRVVQGDFTSAMPSGAGFGPPRAGQRSAC